MKIEVTFSNKETAKFNSVMHGGEQALLERFSIDSEWFNAVTNEPMTIVKVKELA